MLPKEDCPLLISTQWNNTYCLGYYSEELFWSECGMYSWELSELIGWQYLSDVNLNLIKEG